MTQYKDYDYSQMKMIPVAFIAAQLTPGNNLLHLGKKLIAARGIAIAFKSFISETLLENAVILRVA